MYAGKMAELAVAGELFQQPAHPYTVGLMESFPCHHGATQADHGNTGLSSRSEPTTHWLPVQSTLSTTDGHLSKRGADARSDYANSARRVPSLSRVDGGATHDVPQWHHGRPG